MKQEPAAGSIKLYCDGEHQDESKPGETVFEFIVRRFRCGGYPSNIDGDSYMGVEVGPDEEYPMGLSHTSMRHRPDIELRVDGEAVAFRWPDESCDAEQAGDAYSFFRGRMPYALSMYPVRFGLDDAGRRVEVRHADDSG